MQAIEGISSSHLVSLASPTALYTATAPDYGPLTAPAALLQTCLRVDHQGAQSPPAPLDSVESASLLHLRLPLFASPVLKLTPF